LKIPKVLAVTRTENYNDQKKLGTQRQKDKNLQTLYRKVKIGKHKSHLQPVNSGIPEG
jgi:hypothetical protein